MKMFRRITVLFVCLAVFICSAVVVGADVDPELDMSTIHFYGYENYPLDTPIRYLCFEDIERTMSYVGWYKNEYEALANDAEKIEYLSRLWFYNTSFEDGIAWPEEYLDRFEALIKNTAEGAAKCRVDGYQWDNNRLTVDVSGDLSHEDGYVFFVPVIVDKTDGEAVYMGEVENNYLSNSARSKSFVVTMPSLFDPEFHTVELYFCSRGEDEMTDDPVFLGKCDISVDGSCIPYPAYNGLPQAFMYLSGDANRDGSCNISDVSLTLKYISGWGIEIDLAAANMNGDSGVNLVDVSRIMKLIAGWDNI